MYEIIHFYQSFSLTSKEHIQEGTGIVLKKNSEHSKFVKTSIVVFSYLRNYLLDTVEKED